MIWSNFARTSRYCSLSLAFIILFTGMFPSPPLQVSVAWRAANIELVRYEEEFSVAQEFFSSSSAVMVLHLFQATSLHTYLESRDP